MFSPAPEAVELSKADSGGQLIVILLGLTSVTIKNIAPHLLLNTKSPLSPPFPL
jgi:hypothetical protein